MKREQESTILLHPARCLGFGNSAFKLCACRIDQNVIMVVIRTRHHGFDR
jgi:hypothetical protein